MFPPLSLLLSILVTYLKEKMKENDFFFFLKNLDTLGVRMQKYPKSTSIQKVSGTCMTPFLEYPCFIVGKPDLGAWGLHAFTFLLRVIA